MPLHERKRSNPFPSPVSAPGCSLMEVCPLQLNPPWCPHQFVVSAVGIVTQFPLSPDAAAGTDSNGGFLICPGRVDKESGNGPDLSSWADVPASSWGPPGDSQASIPPLHSEKVPPATKRKPEGTAPSTTLPQPNLVKQRSKGEHSCFTTGMDPLKHFMVTSMVNISYCWWVWTGPPHQWGSGVQMGQVLLLPGGCSPHLAADIPCDPAAVYRHLSPPQKHRTTLLAVVALRS